MAVSRSLSSPCQEAFEISHKPLIRLDIRAKHVGASLSVILEATKYVLKFSIYIFHFGVTFVPISASGSKGSIGCTIELFEVAILVANVVSLTHIFILNVLLHYSLHGFYETCIQVSSSPCVLLRGFRVLLRDFRVLFHDFGFLCSVTSVSSP